MHGVQMQPKHLNNVGYQYVAIREDVDSFVPGSNEEK